MTGSSKWCGKTKRLALYIRSGFACGYCQKDLKGLEPCEMGLDHLEDLVNGGGHTGANHAATNLCMVCRSCNSSRGAKNWKAFAAQFPGADARIEALRVLPLNMKLALNLIQGTGEAADR